MASIAQTTTDFRPRSVSAWLPLVLLPVVVAFFGSKWPPYVLMWSLAVAIYAGLKWLTFADSASAMHASLGRSIGYLVLWPGMDARAFVASKAALARPAIDEWLWALAKTLFGLFLVFVATPFAAGHSRLLAGWVGMIGLAFVLHFGLFHVVSVAWRQGGVQAEAIMNAPLRSSSLADFWGRRWNLAFRDVAHNYLFRPLSKRVGIVPATLVVFLVSGLVHDAVMSIPARGGFGLPTLYFCLQGLGLLLERSTLGKRMGLGQGLVGRLLCAIVTIGPLGALFHPPFIREAIIPTLTAVGAM